MLKKIWILTIIFLLVNILSCSSSSKQNPPESAPVGNKMTVDEFVNLYVKLSLAAEEHLADSLQLKQAQDSIFKESGYTKIEFNAFETEMNRTPEKWENIWKQIMDQLEAIRAKQDKEIQEETEEKTGQ
ncbi:hypothetical protein JXI42_06200 [bacterium]|nr:hypothetical protein [bacterium]